jgi:hypothetical protein
LRIPQREGYHQEPLFLFQPPQRKIGAVGRRSSIHHGGVAVDLPRVVEVWWRRKIHGLTDGRVLDVVLSEPSLLTRLQLKELLINMLPMCTNLLCIVFSHIEASKKTLREKVKDTLFLAGGNNASRCGWPTTGRRWLIGGWATGGGATHGSGTRRGMLAQLEKLLNVALVWLVPRMSLVGENINSRHLTNHLEYPRSILATLVGGYGTHNDFLPNEVEDAKVLLPRCHPHKNLFGHIGDIGVVTDLRSESVTKELVQHPIDRFHPMCGTKLHLAIHGIIHESHLTVERKLSTMKLGTSEILLTETKDLSETLI